MKFVLLFASLVGMASAFAPHPLKPTETTKTHLNLDRRGFCSAAAMSLLGIAPAVANAKPASTWFFDEKIEQVYEPAQQATDGRLDLNSAFVVCKNPRDVSFIECTVFETNIFWRGVVVGRAIT